MNDSERAAQAKADIADVERQQAEGELDHATAAMLVGRYRAELDALGAADDSTPQRPAARRIVGTLILGGALVLVAVLAINAVRPRDGGFITGDVGGVDLESVTTDQMEAVIAANPDIPEVAAMRVALADRYFDDGAFSEALSHYLEALGGQLDSIRRARALARIGWMSFVSGRDDLATSYLDQAIATDAGYQEARLFRGLVYLETCRPEDARAELTPLADDPEVPDEIRRDIGVALGRADELVATGGCR